MDLHMRQPLPLGLAKCSGLESRRNTVQILDNSLAVSVLSVPAPHDVVAASAQKGGCQETRSPHIWLFYLLVGLVITRNVSSRDLVE